MARILVTGGNGFLGSHLSEALVEAGNTVSLFDLDFNWHTSSLKAQKITGNVNNLDALSRAARDSDIIIHLAAVSRVEDAELNPDLCSEVNVRGTANAARVAARIGAVLMFSSSREVYGNSGSTPIREDHEKRPVSIYGRSKLVGENTVRMIGRKNGLRYVIFRCSNVFGSTRDRVERVVPRFVAQARAGQPITVHGGVQVLDLTFVDDVVAILAEMTRRTEECANQDYNIVTGKSTSVQNLAELIRNLTLSNSKIEVQAGQGYGASQFFGDPGKLKGLIGQSLRLRGIDEGLPVYLERLREMTVSHM